MKISYRTHPVLEIIENKRVPNFFMVDPASSDGLSAAIKIFWGSLVGLNPLGVYIVRKTFWDSAEKAAKNLLKEDVIGQLNDDSGIYSVGHYSWVYQIIKKDNSHLINYVAFFKNMVISFIYNDTANNCHYKWSAEEVPKDTRELLSTENTILRLRLLSLFKQFAEIDTKVISGGKKAKVYEEKIKNETNTDLTFLDCAWFTNIIRNEGFNVRSHFRLQPKKKNGEWTKELIWINEFQKHGYTRKAGILQANPEAVG